MKIGSAIFCDDVRREDNGKILMVGAYASEIIVSEFPATLILQCLIVVDADEANKLQLAFEFFMDDHLRTRGRGELTLYNKGRILLPIHNLVAQDMKEPCVLRLDLDIGQGMHTVVAIPVKSGPISST